VSNKPIIRFYKSDISWVSDTLFKTNKRYAFGFPFSLEDYHDQIKDFFKRPIHFEGKAECILSEIFNQNVGKLVWDTTTGYINVSASGHSIFAYIPYKDPDLQQNDRINEQENYYLGIQSKAALEKHLNILEKLGFLEVLHTTQKRKKVKLYLEKCNQILKKGTEEKIKFHKQYNQGVFKYGRS
jgi:hypothetical protein